MTYDCERCHWDKQKAQHFKDCPCKCHETIEAVPDIPRCEKCQWPLAKSVEEGCVPGNCSMRPVPKKHAEDSVKFWSDKYDTKVDELHEMWKEARSFEGSFNAAVKSIANQMEIIDRLTKETFDLKKEIVHLKESRSKWAKQSSENADLYEKAISPTQPSPKAPQEREVSVAEAYRELLTHIDFGGNIIIRDNSVKASNKMFAVFCEVVRLLAARKERESDV